MNTIAEEASTPKTSNNNNDNNDYNETQQPAGKIEGEETRTSDFRSSTTKETSSTAMPGNSTTEPGGAAGQAGDVVGDVGASENEGSESGANLHELHSKWVLWHLNGALTKTNYDRALVRVYEVDSVEEFWRLLTHIKEPSELTQESAYCFFHNGIKPAWEDTKNVGALRFSFQAPSAGRARELKPKLLAEIWKFMLLNLIGEQFGEDTDLISGAMLTLKRGDTWRWEYWLKTNDRDNVVRRIAKQMKQILSDVLNAERDAAATIIRVGPTVLSMPPNKPDDLLLDFADFKNDKLNCRM